MCLFVVFFFVVVVLFWFGLVWFFELLCVGCHFFRMEGRWFLIIAESSPCGGKWTSGLVGETYVCVLVGGAGSFLSGLELSVQ